MEEARERRYSTRIRTPDGHWFAVDCPPDKHGKASGATYWGCDCVNINPELSCYEYKNRIALKSRQEKAKRDKILATLRTTTSVPVGGGLVPGRSRDDAAPVSLPRGSAPTSVDDNVGPNPESVPAPTFDEYRRNLLAALKIAGVSA
jgi:hypothetical protein